jgi:hypothetical protein
MELSAIHHIDPQYLTDFQTDLFITSLSHESRCTTVARLFEDRPSKKVALVQPGQLKEFAFRENQAYFTEKQFAFHTVDRGGPDMDLIFNGVAGDEINVILDCTSMSQGWYFEFFRWFGMNQGNFREARLRIVYTMADFVEDGAPQKVRGIRDFLKSESRVKKQKKALILGLGHEKNVSESICKIVKPDLLYLFYADPPVDKRFVEKLFVNNHAIINTTSIRNLISYPISNGQLIYQNLIDTILPLRNDFSITLIPQGPKIFSIASMLAQMGYPDIRISYPIFKRIPVLDRHPCGEPVVLDIHFDGEE